MTLSDDDRGGLPGNADRDPALDRLYRAAGGEKPPAHLDAAILAAAHREARAGPRSQPAALRRWHVPVSIAAVVVLSVSLVTLHREEGGKPPVESLPAAAPAPGQSDAERLRPPAPAPARSRSALQEEARVDAPVALGRLADNEVSGASQIPSTVLHAEATSTPGSGSRSQPQPFRDTPNPAEPRTTESRAATAEGASAPAPVAAERDVAPTAAAPAPEPARARALLQARKETTPGQDKPPIWQGFETAPPEKWLERIAELKHQARLVEAKAMLTEFKRRFPTHPVSPELQ